jgi:hypothetical protein
MKKLLLMTAATFALSGAAAPAFSDDFTFWNVEKGKFTEINDITQIEKTINVYVTDTLELNSNAQALVTVNSAIQGDTVTFATVNQLGTDNTGLFTASGPGGGVTVNSVPLVGSGVLFDGDQGDFDIHRASTITGSVDRDEGVGQLNQDSGNNSNQGNAISAAFVFDKNGTPAVESNTSLTSINGDVAEAEAYVEQLDTGNSSYHIEGTTPTASTGPNISATLTGSFDGDTGVYFGNQNAGNMNSQHNALAAAVGDYTATALADAGLNQVNSGNIMFEINTVKADSITGSLDGDVGIVAFNQSVGNMNNQATVVNVAALASSVGLP